MQDDVLFANLTVQETFAVAAALRLPGRASKETKLTVVNEVIDELGLIKAADTYIGELAMTAVLDGVLHQHTQCCAATMHRIMVVNEFIGRPGSHRGC